MKRTALAAPRAARKSEWLRSALAHLHCPDPGVENEVVVLATGIDQYLQEVFHHLAYSSHNDTVSAEDFRALCAVLGLPGAGNRAMKITEGNGDREETEEDHEFGDVCSGLPGQLSFKDFHSRLCGFFRVRDARAGTGECAWRLPVSEDAELVERQIRLRWPRVRRRKFVSFDLAKDQSAAVRGSISDRAEEERETGEVSALRELVEDLRSALQGSDARCLALEVALRRERSRTLPPASSFTSSVSSPATSITFRQGKLVPTHWIKGQCSGGGARRVGRRQDIRDPLLRELKLIRSSRHGQLEEAMKFNEHLEEELRWAYQEVRKLQGAEAALRKENAQIRRRAEEAREALSMGLQRVRLIQEQAQSVPQLRSRVTQLETKLHQYRSCCTCISDSTRQLTAPVGAEDTCSKTGAECLQRAVEGRAASDEEEEGQCGPFEAKKHVSRLHGCGNGCQNHAVRPLLPHSHLHGKSSVSPSKDSRASCRRRRSPSPERESSRGFEQEKRREEEEQERRRLGEKEKTRLSLLDERLTDALTLLLQLGNKSVSRSALGETVSDTLGASQVLRVADALCLRLASGRDTLLIPSPGRQPSSISRRLISC